MSTSLLDLDNLDLNSPLPVDSTLKPTTTTTTTTTTIIPSWYKTLDPQSSSESNDDTKSTVRTELLIQVYSDKVFVLITQMGRIGTLIQINPPLPGLPTTLSSQTQSPSDLSSPAFASLPPPLPASQISLSNLFGSTRSIFETGLNQLYAQQIAAILFNVFRERGLDHGDGLGFKSLVLGLGLDLQKKNRRSDVTSQSGGGAAVQSGGGQEEEEEERSIGQEERNEFAWICNEVQNGLREMQGLC